MKTNAIIFSAGRNAEDGTWFSLMKIGNIPMIQRIFTVLRTAGIESIFMICDGIEKEAIEQLGLDMPIIFLENAGIKKLDKQKDAFCDCFTLLPTNYPFFTVESVEKLLQCKDSVTVPKNKSKIGYPVVVPYSKFLQFMENIEDNYIKQIEMFLRTTNIEYLPLIDEGLYLDIGDSAEYKRALKNDNLLNWYPKIKFRIANEEPFFGPGSVELLTKIETTQSVRLASEQMQMSYSKSWKLLNELEKQCGYEVLTRTKGGKGGGQTTLTEKGKVLLEWYNSQKKRVDEFSVKLFLENPPPK